MNTKAKILMPNLEGSIPEGELFRENFYLALGRYHFAGKLVKNKTVLEAGCGLGYGSEILIKAGAKKVYAVDKDAEVIKHNRKTYLDKKISFVQSDLRRLPYKDNFFDCITAFEVIEHIKDYRGLVREFYRLLKPGGYLIISTPNKAVYSPGTKKPFYPYHVKEFYLTELKEVLAGFKKTKISGEFIKGKKLMTYPFWHPKRLIRIIFANFPFLLKIGIMRLYIFLFYWADRLNIRRFSPIYLSDIYFNSQSPSKSRVLVAVSQK